MSIEPRTLPAEAAPNGNRTGAQHPPAVALSSMGPAGPAVARAGQSAAGRPSVRAYFLRSAVFVTFLCVGIAALLAAMKGGGFGASLVYSMCIGVCCWLIIEGGRTAVTRLMARARTARGEDPAYSGFPGWPWMVSLAVLGMAIGPIAGTALGDLLLGKTSPSVLRLGSSAAQVTLLLTVLGSVASVVTLTAIERLAHARADAESARRLAAENQLRLLESQLEPHMLFNTLANLRVLIALDPARAQAMLDQLIAFLRATLGASRVARHALGAEFGRLGDYLALMSVRMDTRLQTHFELPAELADCAVPPLLLQPLVENAIKHGLEPTVGGGRIDICAARDGATLVLTVRDTGAGLAHGDPAGTDGTGFGLTQVRERLATLYGADASLQLGPAADGAGGTLATIRLPLQTG